MRKHLLAMALALGGFAAQAVMPGIASADCGSGLLSSLGCTLQNTTTNLTGTVDQTLQTVTTSPQNNSSDKSQNNLVPALTDTVNQIAQPVTQTAANTLAPVTQATGETTAPVLQQAGQAVAPVTEGLTQTLAPVTQEVAENLAPVTDQLAPVVENLKPVLDPIVEQAAPVIEAVAPVLQPVTDATGEVLAPVLETLQPALQPVTDALEPVLSPVVEAVQPVVAPILEATEPILEPITKTIQPVTDPIVEVLEPVVDPIEDTLPPLVDPIVGPTPDPIADHNPGGEPNAPVNNPNPGVETPAVTQPPHVNHPAAANSLAPAAPVVMVTTDAPASGSFAGNLGSPALARSHANEMPPGSAAIFTALEPGATTEQPAHLQLASGQPDSSVGVLVLEGEPVFDAPAAPAAPPATYGAIAPEIATSGGSNSMPRFDWQSASLPLGLLGLLAIGALLLLAVTEASPRTWQFRPYTPPA